MTAAARRLIVAFRRRRALGASWRRLSPAERGEFLMFALLIPTVTLALRTLGFRRTKALLDRPGPAPSIAPMKSHDAAVRALQRARRYAVYRGNCLPQSLALWWRLRRQGIDAELCLGARLDDGQLAAHAWVEAGGRALNDSATVRERFAAFEPLGSSPRTN